MILLCDALKEHGVDHSCTWVSSVQAALDVLQSLVPDIIITDYHMPVSNGLDGIRRIRLLPELETVPVMLYSTVANAYNSDALACGAQVCVQKSSYWEHYDGLIGSINQLAAQGAHTRNAREYAAITHKS